MYTISVRSIFRIILHLCLGLPNALFPLVFRVKFFCISRLPHKWASCKKSFSEASNITMQVDQYFSGVRDQHSLGSCRWPTILSFICSTQNTPCRGCLAVCKVLLLCLMMGTTSQCKIRASLNKSDQCYMQLYCLDVDLSSALNVEAVCSSETLLST
jgi:hypothetical protein